MVTDSQKLDAIVASLHILMDHMERQQLILGEILHQLQQPPSGDLPELLKALVSAVGAQSQKLETFSGILVRLPAEVARRVGG
jgi:hypothetical protein